MGKRVVIVHGWAAEPMEGWRPYLKDQLTSRGFEVIIPDLPNPIKPVLKDWLACINEAVGAVEGLTYFVGHSLGCITLLRFFERLPSERRVGGALLIAGFLSLGKYQQLLSFTKEPLQVERIKAICPRIIALYSDNDPFVPIEQGYEIEKQLGARLIIVPGYRHFSKLDGINELPQALKAILELDRLNTTGR